MTTCIFHVQTQSNAFIHGLHRTFLSSFSFGDAPYSCLLCFPSSSRVAASASLFASLCSSHKWQHEVSERFYSLVFFPFKKQHPLVFNTLSALPLPAVFVFHGASFRRGLFYCLLVCFLIYRSLLWYLQCCATFPVFNSPFKCLQAELLCIVFVLWSIDPFPSKEWCLLFVFM